MVVSKVLINIYPCQELGFNLSNIFIAVWTSCISTKLVAEPLTPYERSRALDRSLIESIFRTSGNRSSCMHFNLLLYLCVKSTFLSTKIQHRMPNDMRTPFQAEVLSRRNQSSVYAEFISDS